MKATLPCGLQYEVDDEDSWILKKAAWRSKHDDSARTTYVVGEIEGKTKRLHRVLLGIEDREIKVDHRDRNGLNNRRSNLRIATQSQNSANSDRNRANTSGYKGVHRGQRKGYVFWRAEITVNGKRMILGQRSNILEAVKLYDDAAVKFFGEFARPNLPR